MTLASLYFLVASGFTLVFGLNAQRQPCARLAVSLRAYVGWFVGEQTGSWVLAVIAGLLSSGCSGC